MFFSTEDTSNQKLVFFYCLSTNAYCALLLTILHFTNRLDSIGKYDFFPAIVAIIFFESAKYYIGKKYYRKKSAPILGRPDTSHKKNSSKNSHKEIFKILGLISSVLIGYYILAVLFGAQIFDKQEETFMLSLLLSVLTVYPACINLGSQSAVLLLLGQKACPDLLGEWLLKSIQLTLLGAWLGAFVIPLDWDRPWQEWPIPCAYGGLAGFISSNILLLGHMYSLHYHSRRSGRKIR